MTDTGPHPARRRPRPGPPRRPPHPRRRAGPDRRGRGSRRRRSHRPGPRATTSTWPSSTSPCPAGPACRPPVNSPASAPDLRTLMLTMYDNEQYFFEALKAGASGYVLKSVADRDLVEACRAALRDEPFIYPGAETTLIRTYLDRARTRRPAARPPHHRTRGGNPQTRRRGPHLQGDRRPPRHQRQDRRTPPCQPAPEARPARPPGTHPLRHPRRPHRALKIPRTPHGS